MALRWAALIIVALVAVRAGSASAATVPSGAADGVQARLDDQTLTMWFAGSARSVLDSRRGRPVGIDCEEHAPVGPLLFPPDPPDSAWAGARVPRTGDTIAAGLEPGRYDVCSLTERSHDGRSDLVLARAAVSPRGEVVLDEWGRAFLLRSALRVLRPTATYRAPDDVVADSGGRIAALAGPGETPPPGLVGYWSDMAARAVLATSSASGRRLFVEDEGDGVLRTNTVEYGDLRFPAERPWPRPRLLRIDDREKGVPAARRFGGAASPFNGMRASVRRGRAVIRFTGRSVAVARLLAGRRIGLRCLAVPPSLALAPDRPVRDHVIITRMPRRAARLVVRVRRTDDVCAVVDDGTRHALVALDAAGRAALAELESHLDLMEAVITELSPTRDGGYHDTVTVARAAGISRLPGPDASPAPGHVGVFSDGARRLTYVALPRGGGRRLLFEDAGDGVMRANTDGPLALGQLLVP